MTWDGDRYQQRFDDLAAAGAPVHGEADFVMGLAPGSVLDAGCGTGRVAIELARRGVAVAGLDRDASMVATARRRAPDLAWTVGDVDGVDLGQVFDVVVMAGNVPLFTPEGTRPALVAGCARHLRAGGALVAGYSLDDRYPADAYDRDCAAAGLVPDGRWSTWDRAPFPGDGAYLVAVHRSPA